MRIALKRLIACLILLVLLFVNVTAIANVGTETLVIPASLQIIEEEAFYNNVSLEKIIVQEGVIEICSMAFANCSNLVSVKLPDSLLKVESAAFKNCNSLKEINLSESVEYIAEDAFEYCPNVVVKVVEGSYAESWCKNAHIRIAGKDNWETDIL